MGMRSRAVYLDDSKKAEEVIRLCLADLHCRVVASGKPCALQWIGNAEDRLRVALEADARSRVSRLPGMQFWAHKVPTARVMALNARLHPEHFRFWPQTWILPEDGMALERHLASGRCRVIVKPDGGSQGDGIFVAGNWSDVRLRSPSSSSAPLVAQEYVARPLTLHGLKFDLRVYVLVSSVSPLIVHLCREGLARFATSTYQNASSRNLNAHLTNYSLNVRDPAFEHNDDPADGAHGSKRSLSATLAELHKDGFDKEAFWEKMSTLVARTCVALKPWLAHSATTLEQAMASPGGSGGGWKGASWRGFSLLGFDVLISEDHKLHLLEVNSNPSLQVEWSRKKWSGVRKVVVSSLEYEKYW